MIISKLNGHSGCQVLLVEENGLLFVRKVSSSIEYNQRLLVQYQKQSNFSSSLLKTPKILASGYQNHLFYFDMEFIRGITLSNYLKQASISSIAPIANIFANHFLSEKEFSFDFSQKTQEIFLNKCSSTYNRITKKNRTINKVYSLLIKHNWSNFSETDCHGDLTLENIMIKNDDIYLIDFLDSFYNSSIIDLSKMLQDLECLWSFRNDNLNDNTIVRLLIFKEILLTNLRNKKPNLIRESYYTLALTLLRIFPYTKDTKTLNFLNEKLSLIYSLLLKEYKK